MSRSANDLTRFKRMIHTLGDEIIDTTFQHLDTVQLYRNFRAAKKALSGIMTEPPASWLSIVISNELVQKSLVNALQDQIYFIESLDALLKQQIVSNICSLKDNSSRVKAILTIGHEKQIRHLRKALLENGVDNLDSFIKDLRNFVTRLSSRHQKN